MIQLIGTSHYILFSNEVNKIIGMRIILAIGLRIHINNIFITMVADPLGCLGDLSELLSQHMHLV